MNDTYIQIANILKNTPDAVWEMVPANAEHSPNSQVTEELARCSESQSKILESAYAQARIGILYVAADHIRAIFRGIIPQPLTYAPWASARCVLEACSMAYWLVDRRIDYIERVTRSLNVRLSVVDEHRKFINSTKGRVWGDSTQEYESPEQKFESLQEQASEFEIDVKRNRNDRIIKFGDKGLPSRTKLSECIFDSEDIYRLLSMATHANSPLIDISTQASTANAPIGYGMMNQYLSEQGVKLIAVYTVDWFARAVWELFVTHGWQIRSLDRVLEDVYNDLENVCNEKFEAKYRFWRNDRLNLVSS